ncbi:DHH family phosphoesterase [Trichloromonas sp.]|uniref:DHH family phosphoesterase n=1 Tax=Trichloromonas sp. TaxID=3069249 RepID=UPI002A4C0263|nr:bifunctional oligoribonuclease/PAP phosphatase NrnA [Trichloromonas sp.]
MIRTILEKIEAGASFLVASHESPDGDAMGSTLALTHFLREWGKEVLPYNRDGIPRDYAFLPGSERVVSEIPPGASFDVGFILDAGELRRAGSGLKDVCRSLVNIDHHPFSENFGDVYYVDEEACATGVLIYRLVKASGRPISHNVALCVYTAILADTGSFRYSNANPEAFAAASELVALGINPWDVASALYESQDEKRLRLLAQALATLTVSSCGRYASVAVTQSMYEQARAGAEHTDGFVNYPRSVHGVEVAIFFRQISPTSFKVGFRSKGRIDVGALSREFGGGGHHNAAGAVVDGPLDEVRATVFSRLDDLLAAC